MAPLDTRGTVFLQYHLRAPVRVRGPSTGRSYDFSLARPVQAIDGRDAEILLRTGHFIRAR